MSIILFAFSGACSYAQSGFGAPVYIQNFGLGDTNALKIGTPLPAGMTSYSFSSDPCPPGFSYTIMRRVNPAGCFADSWIPLASDFTSDYDPAMDKGNMMIINDSESTQSRLVYVDTIQQSLCPGTQYRFSAAFINLARSESCTGNNSFPRFAFCVESAIGTILFTDTTGTLGFGCGFMGCKFSEMGLDFTMPSGYSRLVIRISVVTPAIFCGSDFAIDDIRVRPRGPDVHIGFVPNNADIIQSMCYQHNGQATLMGWLEPHSSINTPALQWQQSNDYGSTWIDIPGAIQSLYTRRYNVPDTIWYRLTGADASVVGNVNCRVVSEIRKVQVDGLPSNISVGSNSPVCSGSELLFQVEGGATYEWFGPNGYYDNISYAHISRTTLKDSGVYYVDVVTLGGCKKRDSVIVKIIGVDVSAGNDTAVCLGTVTTLSASAGKSYRWYPAGMSNDTIHQTLKVSPHDATRYTVQVTATNGCSDTASVLVSVLNKKALKAVIEANDFLCPLKDSILFSEKSTGEISSWYWQFGNGETSNAAKPGWQYYSNQLGQPSIPVTLTVGDLYGCKSTDTHLLRVVDNCYIAVPSGFTPNGDGKNDYLYPLNAYKARDLRFRVFNRYGGIVFDTQDWMRKWDGKVGGTPQPAGTYVWILEYIDTGGQKISLKGTTVLIR